MCCGSDGAKAIRSHLSPVDRILADKKEAAKRAEARKIAAKKATAARKAAVSKLAKKKN